MSTSHPLSLVRGRNRIRVNSIITETRRVKKSETGNKFFGKQELSGLVSLEFDRCRAATLLSVHRTGPDTAIAFWKVWI
jgi:hypothetical protein